MTMRKPSPRATSSAHLRGERMKDEVYRQMFRLEEGRAGAGIALAVALLRAWIAACSGPPDSEDYSWLKKISVICVEMIEGSAQMPGPATNTEP